MKQMVHMWILLGCLSMASFLCEGSAPKDSAAGALKELNAQLLVLGAVKGKVVVEETPPTGSRDDLLAAIRAFKKERLKKDPSAAPKTEDIKQLFEAYKAAYEQYNKKVVDVRYKVLKSTKEIDKLEKRRISVGEKIKEIDVILELLETQRKFLVDGSKDSKKLIALFTAQVDKLKELQSQIGPLEQQTGQMTGASQLKIGKQNQLAKLKKDFAALETDFGAKQAEIEAWIKALKGADAQADAVFAQYLGSVNDKLTPLKDSISKWSLDKKPLTFAFNSRRNSIRNQVAQLQENIKNWAGELCAARNESHVKWNMLVDAIPDKTNSVKIYLSSVVGITERVDFPQRLELQPLWSHLNESNRLLNGIDTTDLKAIVKKAFDDVFNDEKSCQVVVPVPSRAFGTN